MTALVPAQGSQVRCGCMRSRAVYSAYHACDIVRHPEWLLILNSAHIKEGAKKFKLCWPWRKLMHRSVLYMPCLSYFSFILTQSTWYLKLKEERFIQFIVGRLSIHSCLVPRLGGITEEEQIKAGRTQKSKQDRENNLLLSFYCKQATLPWGCSTATFNPSQSFSKKFSELIY